MTTMHGYRQALDKDLGAVYHEWRIADRQDIQHADQDHRDGAALRRLREALPEGWGFRLAWATHYIIELFDDLGYSGGITVGATIAEAADACREALK